MHISTEQINKLHHQLHDSNRYLHLAINEASYWDADDDEDYDDAQAEVEECETHLVEAWIEFKASLDITGRELPSCCRRLVESRARLLEPQ